MITLTSKDYSYIIIKDLNLGPNKTGTIDETGLILSELKSIENLYLVKKLEISSLDLEKVRARMDLLDGNESSGDSPIQSISLNGTPLVPDNNKNININVSSSGGGINVIDYNPEDYVTITGPEINPSISQGSQWNEPYLTLNGNSELVSVTPDFSYRSISIDLDIPSSGAIELDITSASLLNGNNTQNTNLVFMQDNSNVPEVFTCILTGQPPRSDYYFSFISIYKGSSNNYSINCMYDSAVAGQENTVIETDSAELTIRFMNYIEFMIQVNEMTIEQIYDQLPAEQIAAFSSLKVAVIYEKGSPINTPLIAVPIDATLSKLNLGVYLMPATNDTELLSQTSLKIDNKSRVYTLPEVADGTYLKILSDVILLGQKLETGDHFILHSNSTKGIRIKLYNDAVSGPTGRFRGESYTEPTDPVIGDWYIKNVYNSSTNSYSNLMYVWSNNSWELVGYVPVSGSGNLSGLSYNTSTNRLMNSSGKGVAGYLGAFYTAPSITYPSESSLYYNIGEDKFYSSIGGSWSKVVDSFNFADYIDEYTNNYAIPRVGALKSYIDALKISYIDPANNDSTYLTKLTSIEAIKNYVTYNLPTKQIKERLLGVPSGCEVMLKKYYWSFDHYNKVQSINYMAKKPLRYLVGSNTLEDMSPTNFGIITTSAIVYDESETNQTTSSFAEDFLSLSIHLEIPFDEEERNVNLFFGQNGVILTCNNYTITEQHLLATGSYSAPVTFSKIAQPTNFIVSFELEGTLMNLNIYRVYKGSGSRNSIDLIYNVSYNPYNTATSTLNFNGNASATPVKIIKTLLTTII